MQAASVSLRCFWRCRAVLRWKVVPMIPSPLTCGTQGEAQGEPGMSRSWRDTPTARPARHGALLPSAMAASGAGLDWVARQPRERPMGT